MQEQHRFERELATLDVREVGPSPVPIIGKKRVERKMKFEIQTRILLFKVKGNKRTLLGRKEGPKGYLIKGTGCRRINKFTTKEWNTIELQSEAHGFIEFETPNWSHDWCEVKERIQAALDMVEAINNAVLLRIQTREVDIRGKLEKRNVRTVKFPFNTTRLYEEGYLEKGEHLEIDIIPNEGGDTKTWPARIQASESFKLSQFDSYVEEYLPKEHGNYTNHAKNILAAANSSKIPDAALDNPLYNFLLIIVMYVEQIEAWTTHYAGDKKLKKDFYASDKDKPLAKMHLQLMCRTNFAWIYKKFLNVDEQKLFKTIVDKQLVLKELDKNDKDKLFRKGFNGLKPSPTIHRWLKSIYDPEKTKRGERDYLSNIGGDNDAMGRFPLEEKGRDIDWEDQHLIKFEARKPDPKAHQNDVPATKWLNYAEEVFKGAQKRNSPGFNLHYDPSSCKPPCP